MQTSTYLPWIGPIYGKSELRKLLIIGDSHYFNNDEPENLADFTKAQIAELDDISSNFHNRIIQIFVHQKHSDFWQKVAFANGIQSVFTSANQVPTKAEKDRAELAFKEYLNSVKPDKVVVFSSRLWEHFLIKPVGARIWGKSMTDGTFVNLIMMVGSVLLWVFIILPRMDFRRQTLKTLFSNF